MTKLAPLRRRLKMLRRRRRTARWGTGLSAALLAVLWMIALLFAVDVLLEMTTTQRVIAMAVTAGVILWAMRRYALPWFGHREDLLDMALLVQRQHRIDSDLVAALQFETPEAAEWGSRQLEDVVIGGVSQRSKRLNVLEGFSRRRMVKRMAALVVTLAGAAAVFWLFPDYVGVFARRMLLGSDHYPTETVIERIVVNGQGIPTSGERPVIRCPYGQPLAIEVHCSGRLPDRGTAVLKAVEGKRQIERPLETDEDHRGVYSGGLERLVESVTYQLYLGDAWTEEATVELVPLPLVHVGMEVIAPDYCGEPAKTYRDLRQISVIEGSRVVVRLDSDKALTRAELQTGQHCLPLTKESSGEEGETWSLDPAGTPLESVMQATAYEIQVSDEDGLALADPVDGLIRIKPDERPRVGAAIRTPVVHPNAAPRVAFTAVDDYGVERVVIRARITRSEEVLLALEAQRYESEPDPAQGQPPEVAPPPKEELREQQLPVYQRPDGKTPQKTVSHFEFPIELSDLKVSEGDLVEITLIATDHRGKRPGQQGASEPLVFRVTDPETARAAITEIDPETAQRLKEIIQRQLGIGDTR